jgi:ubiquinone/menaquinone biosynthesis C-methylase UbiE
VGFYEERVLPHVVDLALSGKSFRKLRARVAGGLSGEVLEVGFGSGRNVPYYPQAVTRVRAIDPSSGGRRLAQDRIAASPVPVEFIGLDGEDISLPDASVDHVLTTWTLCTIPDDHRALTEIRRVLRPGGSLHFLEHGRAPDPAVARWQDRLTPWQKRWAGGCHLNRPIDEMLTEASLPPSQLRNYYLKGPRVFGYMYEGLATKA